MQAKACGYYRTEIELLNLNGKKRLDTHEVRMLPVFKKVEIIS